MRKTAIAFALSLLGAGTAIAAPQDYRLDVTSIGGSRDALVRIIHVPTGKVVDNAEIYVREQITPPKGGVIYRDAKLRHDAEGRHVIGGSVGLVRLWASVRGTGDVVQRTIVLR